MNHTAQSIGQTITEQQTSPEGAIVLLLVLVGLFFTGIFLGVAMMRTPNATRRVQLAALQQWYDAYTAGNPDAPVNGDHITRSIARRQIRRLQDSLRIDNDQE